MDITSLDSYIQQVMQNAALLILYLHEQYL